MAISVSNNPYTGNISVGNNVGGSQGGNVNPQGSNITIQGTSPTLQSASTAGIKLQNTSNPQVVANWGAPLPPANNAAANSVLQQSQNLLNQYGYGAGPVYAPKLDLAAINAQARAAAQNNVNPFYVKSLNDFVAQQASEKAQQQAQTDINIKNLKDTLTNTQAANATTGERTTEDTATKEANIAQTADWRQTDQGGQYDIDRVSQAIQQAKSGLTGSGIAAGAAASTQEKFNTTESRQATGDQQAKAQAELLKARTFEDLGTSNKLAGEVETKGETQQNVNLTNFLTNQGFTLQNEKNDLEQKRLQSVAAESQTQAKLLVDKFIASIANPAQRMAALQAYGNAF